jgi:BirA family biotin operon repressor/biotin-[acetyl-CoA-carboxylase] ligase
VQRPPRVLAYVRFALTLGFLYLLLTSSGNYWLELSFPQGATGLDFLIEMNMDEVQVGSISGIDSWRLDVEGLRHQLGTMAFGVGDRLIYLPVVTSTNSFAMQLAQERAEEGVVVLTDSQTAGKGRQGRRWVDMSGCNVLSSTLLRPLFPSHLLVMVASLAVVQAITETCGIAATIKWPNDVLIEDRKVAGILIETSHDSSGRLVAILGIGVNVNGRILEVPGGASLITADAQHSAAREAPLYQDQAPVVTGATTLEAECGHVLSRETFIAHMLRHLETDYFVLQEEAGSPYSLSNGLSASQSLRERWRNCLSTLGRTISVRQGGTVISGVAEDVDENGELLLRSHSGELINITWGDVGYPAG